MATESVTYVRYVERNYTYNSIWLEHCLPFSFCFSFSLVRLKYCGIWLFLLPVVVRSVRQVVHPHVVVQDAQVVPLGRQAARLRRVRARAHDALAPQATQARALGREAARVRRVREEVLREVRPALTTLSVCMYWYVSVRVARVAGTTWRPTASRTRRTRRPPATLRAADCSAAPSVSSASSGGETNYLITWTYTKCVLYYFLCNLDSYRFKKKRNFWQEYLHPIYTIFLCSSILLVPYVKTFMRSTIFEERSQKVSNGKKENISQTLL